MTKTTTMAGLESGGSNTATIGRGGSIVLGLGRGDDDGERNEGTLGIEDYKERFLQGFFQRFGNVNFVHYTENIAAYYISPCVDINGQTGRPARHDPGTA
ncbi:hypothetical protein OsJ_36273 [Oryza sativa Japonica Group]|uniref:Uncharacterized protein n=1 Tax=Oryza sativa subsp. japonica TaxID=39947 RepID=A3CHU6_ORYSJ|nr:hypothetical protein OsJ_36273 [Oryza sativa Japonica Group]